MNWRVLLGLFCVIAISAASGPAIYAADPLVDQIVKLIRNPDREFRAAALEQVRKGAPGQSRTETFAALLSQLEPAAQAELVNALGDRRDMAARPAVLKTLSNSSDENVRAAAFAALGDIGGADDLPLLEKTLASSSGSERQAARSALVRMKGNFVIKRMSQDSTTAESSIRAALIEILATRRAISESSTFVAASRDSNAQVREAAMNALGQLGSPKQLSEIIVGVLRAEKGTERESAERAVAMVCSRIENEDQRSEALIAAVQSVDGKERDILLPVMGRVGGKKLIDFVGNVATGSDPARRLLGIDALSKWPDSSPSDALANIVDRTSDPTERKQAFQAYVKVAASRDQKSDKDRLERMKQAMKSAKTIEEKSTVINRSRTAYDVETLRFISPFLDQDSFAQIACESIV
ncbi:MAG: hypothetical protein FJ267_11125, partial [Planctomycetes bacterium]|nr:hypothetical protein [Planctomycetota bacterium]